MPNDRWEVSAKKLFNDTLLVNNSKNMQKVPDVYVSLHLSLSSLPAISLSRIATWKDIHYRSRSLCSRLWANYKLRDID